MYRQIKTREDGLKLQKEFLVDRENFTYPNLPEKFPKTKKGFFLWCSQFEDLAIHAYNAGYISFADMCSISPEFAQDNQLF